MGSLIKTQSHLKNRDWQNLDTHTQTHSLKLTLKATRTHTRFDSSMYLKPSLSHTHTKIPRRPAPATRAVYQVIIV